MSISKKTEPRGTENQPFRIPLKSYRLYGIFYVFTAVLKNNTTWRTTRE